MTTIPTCCVTGAIVGDGGACGDCDPCIGGGDAVPEVVKRLIAEKNSLGGHLGNLEGIIDLATQRLNESGTGEMGLIDTIHAVHAILRDAR